MSVVQYSFSNEATILRRIITFLRETCANLREHLLMMMVGAGWVACCFVLAGCCWLFCFAKSWAAKRTALRSAELLLCEKLLTRRQIYNALPTNSFAAGWWPEFGKLPLPNLARDLAQTCVGFGQLFFARCLPTIILTYPCSHKLAQNNHSLARNLRKMHQLYSTSDGRPRLNCTTPVLDRP